MINSTSLNNTTHKIPAWTALTALATFLILLATALFGLQGRQGLRDEIGSLEIRAVSAEGTRTALESNALEATVSAGFQFATPTIVKTETPIPTPVNLPETDPDTLSQENIIAQAQVAATAVAEATSIAAAEEARAVLEAEQAIQAQLPPEVHFFAPPTDRTVTIGESVEFGVSAYDTNGLMSINIAVNNELIGSYSSKDQRLHTVRDQFVPELEGEYQFEAYAVNLLGKRSDIIAISISVIDPVAQAERELALSEQIETVKNNVLALRGGGFEGEISATLLTERELRERFEEEFAEEVTPKDARDSVIELYAFDFVDLEYDLYPDLLDLYSSIVLGSYDLETNELIIVSDDSELSPSEEVTLAHEIMHAIQDQRYQIEMDELNSEEQMALRSLAEGESQLLEQLYISSDYLTEEEVAALIAEIQTQTLDIESIPDVILDQLQFPYSAGLNFVRSLYEDGGFEAVDAAWENPPRTTEHILHPERFLRGDAPLAVAIPPLTDTIGTGWEMVVENTLGEFSMWQYLGQEVDQEQASEAVEGWGGDQYMVYWNEEEQTFLLAISAEWDTLKDAEEFALAYQSYAERSLNVESTPQENGTLCWLNEDVACLARLDSKTVVVRGPELAVVEEILQKIISE